MTYVIAFLIALFGGWSVAACEALFRTEERSGSFRGNTGMLLLLAVAAIGGLILANALVWALKIIPSASAALLLVLGGLLGASASNRLNATAAGAANRTLVGLAGLAILYGIAWSFFPLPG
jgi:hypothetical protein